MTQDQGEEDIQEPADASGDAMENCKAPDTAGGAEGTKPRRRIAKTVLLDVDSPEFQKLRHLLALDENKPTPPRDVAKTLFDVDLPSIAQPLTEKDAIETPKTVRRVSRTLVDADSPLAQAERLHVEPAEPSASQTPKAPQPAAKPKPNKGGRATHFVAKTMLDCNVLAETLSKYNDRKREIVEEEAKIRALLPPVEYVEGGKKALPCPWSWDDANSKERSRYCDRCHERVYDLDGMELQEAEALIFTMENKRNPTLYKRLDGKFMTQDCPVAVKQKKQLVLLSVAGIALVLSSLVALILNPPKFPPPTAPSLHDDADEIEHLQAERTSQKNKAGLSKAEREADLDLQKELNGTGKRKRPTFTPADTDKYWE